MLFDFDHTTRMTCTSLIIQQAHLEENAEITMRVSKYDAKKLNLFNDAPLLVLLTNGEESILETPNVVKSLETGEYSFTIAQDQLSRLSLSPGDTLTAWVTNKTDIGNISIRNQPATTSGNSCVGDETDPTGGSWLFVREHTLSYREDKDAVSGGMHIPAQPFREHITLLSDSEYEFKITHKNQSEIISPTLRDSGAKFTIGLGTRNRLGIDKDERTVCVWIRTDSIVQHHESNTQDSSNDSLANEDSDEAERTGVSDSSTETLQLLEQPSGDDDDSNRVGSEQITEESTVQLDSINTTNGDVSSDPQSHNENGGIKTRTTDEINVEYNSEITPVVILDDDERLQEDWTGHYVDDDGELLCGKTYSNAVKDPEKEHYTSVCEDCALAHIGGITDKDLSELLQKHAGVSVGDSVPFVLDREDAAKLFMRITELKNKLDALK